MWLGQWVRCSQELSQWDALSEYARSTEQAELGADCAWRLGDWVMGKVWQLKCCHPVRACQSFPSCQAGSLLVLVPVNPVSPAPPLPPQGQLPCPCP